MAYVRGKITADDVKSYGMEDQIGWRVAEGSLWVVDLEKRSYLRRLYDRRGAKDSDSDENGFHFYWSGFLIKVILLPQYSFRHSDGKFERHWQLKEMELPEELQSKREAVLHDLTEALKAYGIGLGAQDGDIIKLIY